MYIDKRWTTISYQRMIQQYLTVERLYLRKKHFELTTRQRFLYCWRKSKVRIKMPWSIWLSVTLKTKTKIIPWKWSKGWDCFSRCSGLLSHPVTLPLHPLSQPHYSPLKPLIDCSGCNCWLGPLVPLFPPVASPLLPLLHSQMCSYGPTNMTQVFLPHTEGRHSHVSPPNLRGSRNWTDHGAGTWEGQVSGIKNVFPLNMQSLGKTNTNKQTKKVECCQVDRKSTLL